MKQKHTSPTTCSNRKYFGKRDFFIFLQLFPKTFNQKFGRVFWEKRKWKKNGKNKKKFLIWKFFLWNFFLSTTFFFHFKIFFVAFFFSRSVFEILGSIFLKFFIFFVAIYYSFSFMVSTSHLVTRSLWDHEGVITGSSHILSQSTA